MCGRLNVTADPLTQLLMDAFGIIAVPGDNHNLAPTEPLLAVRSTGAGSGTFRADELRWWLTPSWSSGPSTKYAMFNAKSETLHEKRAFARPFRSQRCVVPVTGYYEWQRSEREKLPFYVHCAQGQGLLLAGLWDAWTNKATGELLESCSIVTAAAHDGLSALHHRQPVFLSASEACAWLDPGSDVSDLAVLLEPHLPASLCVEPVSTYVNNARNKDPRCVQPIAEPIFIGAETGPDVGSSRSRTPHPSEMIKQDLFDVD